MVGLGIMFGLAYLMYSLTSDDFRDYFIWMLIFNGLVVYGGLLPLWTLVLSLLIVSIILIIESKKRGVSI